MVDNESLQIRSCTARTWFETVNSIMVGFRLREISSPVYRRWRPTKSYLLSFWESDHILMIRSCELVETEITLPNHVFDKRNGIEKFIENKTLKKVTEKIVKEDLSVIFDFEHGEYRYRLHFLNPQDVEIQLKNENSIC